MKQQTNRFQFDFSTQLVMIALLKRRLPKKICLILNEVDLIHVEFVDLESGSLDFLFYSLIAWNRSGKQWKTFSFFGEIPITGKIFINLRKQNLENEDKDERIENSVKKNDFIERSEKE